MQITNAYDASLVTINPQAREAVEFRERYVQFHILMARFMLLNLGLLDNWYLNKFQDAESRASSCYCGKQSGF